MRYEPSDYWQRLHERGDLSGVGQSGLPESINAWLYRALATNLARFIHKHEAAIGQPARVFEIGVGTGYWIDLWRRLGARRVDGCDLVPNAVDRLNAIYGSSGYRFFTADITSPTRLTDASYDLVAVLNVFLHIVDTTGFRQALRNAARLVAPGGTLILAEPLLFHSAWEQPLHSGLSSVARDQRAYLDELEAEGLRLVALEPATVLANNPIEAGSRAGYGLLRIWWGLVSALSKISPHTAVLVGPLVYACDQIAMHTGWAPSTKLVLLSRPRSSWSL